MFENSGSIPPFNHLCRALCSSTCFCISLMSMRSLSSRPTDDDLTTKAFGSSPAASSGIGMTAASPTAGCVRRWASSSAGATCKPLRKELVCFLTISWGQGKYLDFDQLLNSVHNENMFVPLGTPPNHCFVSSSHPTILECLFVCLGIVEVSENNAG